MALLWWLSALRGVQEDGDCQVMVITQNLIIDAAIAAARVRLARIVRGGGLTEVCGDAYGGAITDMIRIGPVGDTPGVSKQVRVRLIGPVRRDAVTTIWMRLQPTGAASGLFPVLDGDLTLTAEGPEQTRLTLNAGYQPPFGRIGAGIDRAVMHRAASATIRALLHSIATALDESGSVRADGLPVLRSDHRASDTLDLRSYRDHTPV